MSLMSDAQRLIDLERRARQAGLEPWQLEAANAVGSDLIRDVVRDGRRRPIHQPEAPAIKSGNGWIDAAPLPSSPPGMRIIDRMIDAQDAIDSAERESQFSSAGMSKPSGGA